MAYPYNYAPNYIPNYNPYPQQLQQIQQQTGFVTVRSEDDARNYPVAPGNSITFRDETGPFIYTKTMGAGQFDRPVFEKYRLVKEQGEVARKQPENASSVDYSAFAMKTDVEELKAEIEAIKGKFKVKEKKNEQPD